MEPSTTSIPGDLDLEPGSSPGAGPGRFLEWVGLVALMAGFSAIFFAFYPPFPGIEDEVGFINQTLIWSKGSLNAEGAGYSDLADFFPLDGKHVPARHPGRSLVALPFFYFGGVQGAFASGLVLHLIATLIAAFVFVRLGRSPLWATLLLVHPTLALYSRTIMADSTAGTGLLLALLALTSRAPWAGFAAGASIGLAAAMRYHSALAVPFVALAFLLPKGRPHAWRDAILCVIGAGASGSLIALYNLTVYGTLTEPFTGKRGFFSFEFLVPHLIYYGSALMVVWPCMLIAPLVDKSPVRWAVRGLCALYLGFLTLYYFHDKGANWLETAIVGQRLLQVALPVWIVSYGGMLDDWVAAPIRRLLSPVAWKVLVAVACVCSLMPIEYAFSKHQQHLQTLSDARDAVVANIPEGSLILFERGSTKLVGVPTESPIYRIRPLTYELKPIDPPGQLEADLAKESRPWFVALLGKGPKGASSDFVRDFLKETKVEPIETYSPVLSLYVHRPQVPAPTPALAPTPASAGSSR